MEFSKDIHPSMNFLMTLSKDIMKKQCKVWGSTFRTASEPGLLWLFKNRISLVIELPKVTG